MLSLSDKRGNPYQYVNKEYSTKYFDASVVFGNAFLVILGWEHFSFFMVLNEHILQDDEENHLRVVVGLRIFYLSRYKNGECKTFTLKHVFHSLFRVYNISVNFFELEIIVG